MDAAYRGFRPMTRDCSWSRGRLSVGSKPAWPMSAAISPAVREVAVVRSHWSSLSATVPPDSTLTRAQIKVLVKAALDQLGGLSRFVRPEHKWVVIRPDIVEVSQRGSGDITDSNETVDGVAVDPRGNPWFGSGGGVATLALPPRR